MQGVFYKSVQLFSSYYQVLLIEWEQWDKHALLQAAMVLVMSGDHDMEHIIRMYMRSSYKGSACKSLTAVHNNNAATSTCTALKLSQGVYSGDSYNCNCSSLLCLNVPFHHKFCLYQYNHYNCYAIQHRLIKSNFYIPALLKEVFCKIIYPGRACKEAVKEGESVGIWLKYKSEES